MQLKRAVISFLLIFSYSFGFAHSMIPHCETLLNGNHIHSSVKQHAHKHHASVDSSHNNHDHIIHGNHFDEGIYDLLLCFFSDLEHGESECNMQHDNPTELSIQFNQQEVIGIISTFITLFSAVENQEKKHYSDIIEVRYSSPELVSPSLRGPPVIS